MLVLSHLNPDNIHTYYFQVSCDHFFNDKNIEHEIYTLNMCLSIQFLIVYYDHYAV